MKTITFKDRVKLYIKSGHGGDGCVSFRREKFVPRGGPDGGDGGHGGSVYLVADANADSLLDLYYRPHQKAEHGGAGRNKQCHGKNGKDLHLKVPCGTVAFNESSDQRLGEVLEPGDTLLVAKGGRGGKGNIHFATSTHQAPTEFTHGTPGEDITAWLELKMVADAGLVGYPNAGKSTLIRELSGARPKVASYPFTTLNPIIGIVQFEDYRTLRVADIPGLIDGAHEGVGLGHDFLRHIERCPFLIFVLDMGGVDGRDPTEDFLNLRDELKKYQADLDDRPYIVVANKMDLEDSEDHLAAFEKETGLNPLPVIAELNEGVQAIKDALYEQLLDA